MQISTPEYSPDVVLGFNPGNPRAIGEIGRLVGVCRQVIDESGENVQRVTALLPGVQDVPAAIKRMPNLSGTLIERGDHPFSVSGSPLQSNLDRVIVEAVVMSAAEGSLPVERASVKKLVEQWSEELYSSQSRMSHMRSRVRERVQHSNLPKMAILSRFSPSIS